MAAGLLDFTCVIITGGGGGIGFALAEHFVFTLGKKVILVGRTESNLKEASKKLKDAPHYVLDTGKIQDIPAFRDLVIKEHPEVDALINNAGVQRPLEVTDLDLKKLDEELNINVRGPIHLADAFLKHFASKSHAVIMNVTSVLGFIPFSIINPNYNGTKAHMHFYTMAQRTQLKNTSVRVVEIAPPQVHTALHREREDPDDNNPEKSPTSLTTDEFVRQVMEQLKEGKDTVSAGPGKEIVKKWYDSFGEHFQGAADKWEGKGI